ncbi:LacI family DNA-binding transcriptional regulator [Microbacterium sp. RD1]|uniref:LacI family DNA-binding transcriptional regulator n=1 Tax=Microbacterium sp. RD1 TaxID=3457313 RepID=UPI003FA576BC
MARRATRDDVARLAGTSTAVVSYVINDGPRNVSDEKRSKVLAAMEQLQYYPNALARSLAATSTRTIGMIVPNISNAYFSELALEVEEVARRSGRIVFLGNSNESAALETTYVDAFIEQRVGGILLVGVAQSTALARAAGAGIPVVVVDRALSADADAPGWSTVSIDHRAAAQTAVVHLLEHGHREIGCLNGPADQAVAQDRRRGWEDALRQAGIDPSAQMQLSQPFSLEGGRAAAAAVADASHRPTALFVASDEQARGFISHAGERGIRVPDDLSIVSVDGTREGAYANPPLTTVQQPYRHLAEAALSSLRLTDAHNTFIETRLVTRRSCGCTASPNTEK